MAPRETKNNAYAKFWGDKQRTLWYVTVISGVVNYQLIMLMTNYESLSLGIFINVREIFQSKNMIGYNFRLECRRATT